jgi:copper chaperone CopZ
MGGSSLDIAMIGTLMPSLIIRRPDMPLTTDLCFTVPDMDCGGCVRSITEAIHHLDPVAKVEADLETKLVSIGGVADAKAYAKAIEDAGFTAEPKA